MSLRRPVSELARVDRELAAWREQLLTVEGEERWLAGLQLDRLLEERWLLTNGVELPGSAEDATG